MKKGSITVFSVLCMSFVFSALFVLLEAARFYGLSQYADWKGRQGVECVAAEYQPYLWKSFVCSCWMVAIVQIFLKSAM